MSCELREPSFSEKDKGIGNPPTSYWPPLAIRRAGDLQTGGDDVDMNAY